MLRSESTSSSLSLCYHSEFSSSKGTLTNFSRNSSVNWSMVAWKNDSDLSCLVRRGEISSNGLMDCRLEDPVFIVSYIPATFQPFMITDEPFFDVISLYYSTNHLAWSGLRVVKRNAFLISSTFIPRESLSSICWAYHSENNRFRYDLQCLLTVKSRGWKSWVILFGTKTEWILLFLKREITSSVIWPKKYIHDN